MIDYNGENHNKHQGGDMGADTTRLRGKMQGSFLEQPQHHLVNYSNYTRLRQHILWNNSSNPSTFIPSARSIRIFYMVTWSDVLFEKNNKLESS